MNGTRVAPIASKVRDVADAIGSIDDGMTVVIPGSGGGVLEPDLLIATLGERFERTGSPRGLTIYNTLGLGDRVSRGLAPLAREGLLARAVGGHWGQTPEMSRLAEAEAIEAYNLPSGVMSLLLREVAGGRPGLFTKVGLGTFIDPREAGGRLNSRSKAALVEVAEVAGEEWLFYPAPRFDAALIRGWTADERGNLSLRDEAAYLDTYVAAAATRACGGRVIAQVKEVVPWGAIHPKEVHVPAALVDDVVVHTEQWQTYEGEFDPGFAGHERDRAIVEPAPFDARKVIARRAALEISPGSVVNLGVGIPDGIAAVLKEEDVIDAVTFSVEHGIFGGLTAQGAVFGACRDHEAVVPMPSMFDFYHSGGLDAAFLGFAQIDREGNANVSKYQGTIMGTGGFVDIVQQARTLVFCGTLRARGLQVRYEDGRAAIVREGEVAKFIPAVDQITFSGRRSRADGQRVLVVTERAVLELAEDGWVVSEVADGLDVERDVVEQMGFEPRISDHLKRFAPWLVDDGPIGLKARWQLDR